MKRRLFILLPDTRHAEQLGSDLDVVSIKQQDIHAMTSKGVSLKNIDDVQTTNKRDLDFLIDWWSWRINLALFFIATIAFIATLMYAPSYWLLLPALVMIVTFSLGLATVLYLPNVHIDEFRPAVRHGEILVMVDAPPSHILDISSFIRRRHPEALIGGVGWHLG